MNLGDLAKKIWPHLRPNVEQVVTNGAASRGGSGGGGALTAHSMSGAYHTGTLADSQAPQFLMVDGSRQLTGNMLVATGITIDGVDISEHEAATGTSVHGLGTMSTQGANAVAITGGSIAGITDLAIADGGTGASNATDARTNLGLVIGTNVQAWDADLDTIAGLAKTDGNFIVGNGSAWVAESGSTARTSLGLGTGDSPTFTDLTVTGLSASRLVATNGSDALTSVSALSSWVAGTSNRVSVSDDGDGTITLTTPQDTHTSASPTFAGLTVNGNIAVTGTVDGVDVSAHASRHHLGGADPVSHDSLTGYVADRHVAHSGVVLTAGNGLTGGGDIAASRSFAVGAGTGILSNADDVAVNTAYGFTWTGAHEFREDLQVYNPANLTTPVLYVDQSAYAVGINRDPDIQFSLDIAGAARADYWVGKHAIQLADAILIAHYDGPGPYKSDYTGTPQGHKGQIGTEVGGVIYRGEGKFGKAVQVAGATTNLIVNPSFEDSLNGWTIEQASGDSSTASSNWVEYGEYGYYLNKTNAGGLSRIYQPVTLTNGQSYTLSAYGLTNFSDPNNVMVYHGSYGVVGSLQFGATWSRQTDTFTAPASGTFYIYIQLTGGGTGTGYLYCDAVQLEQKSYATPFCDSSMGDGYTLNGDNTTTRAAAYLTYSSENLVTTAGTIMCWTKLSSNTSNMSIVRTDGSASTYIMLRASVGTSQYTAYWGSTAISGGTLVYDEWVHLAVTFDGTNVTLYVNGTQVQQSTPGTTFTGLTSTFGVGASPSGTLPANGLIDELVILSRAAPGDEIRSVYESDAPVFAESSTSFFKNYGPTPVEINEEGLFVRSVTTGAVLGVYGGGSTKSWGGKTLGDADILIGRDPDGYIHWDDSATLMDILAQVNISGSSQISGSLSVAGGDILLDSAGIFVEGNSSENSPDVSSRSLRLGASARIYEAETIVGGIYDAGWLILESTGYGELSYAVLRANNTDPSGNGVVYLIANGSGGQRNVQLNGGGNLDVGTSIQMTGYAEFLLLPDITTTQRNALSAVAGKLIFNVSTGEFQGYNGSTWVTLG